MLGKDSPLPEDRDNMSTVVSVAFHWSSREATAHGVRIKQWAGIPGLASFCYGCVAVLSFSILPGGSLVELGMCPEVPMVKCGPSRQGCPWDAH